jgi:Ala-tRNA(Pro) deacylase
MTGSHRIKEYLLHNDVSYAHRTHCAPFTAKEVSDRSHLPGTAFTRTVVLDAGKRLIMAVLPADRFVNLDVLKKHAGCDKLSIASEKERIKAFPGFDPDGIPPFGKLFGLPLYADSALSKRAEIEFNAGTNVDTIRMTYASFVNLENPMVLSFSEKHGSPPAARTA